jgi:DNA-directed RNA polymerase subunit H (RpoH/RPB5)
MDAIYDEIETYDTVPGKAHAVEQVPPSKFVHLMTAVVPVKVVPGTSAHALGLSQGTVCMVAFVSSNTVAVVRTVLTAAMELQPRRAEYLILLSRNNLTPYAKKFLFTGFSSTTDAYAAAPVPVAGANVPSPQSVPRKAEKKTDGKSAPRKKHSSASNGLASGAAEPFSLQRVDHFLLVDLQGDVGNHSLVPPHIPLTAKEQALVKERYPGKFPSLLTTDPQVRYLGIPTSHIIMVKEQFGKQQPHHTYFQVRELLK